MKKSKTKSEISRQNIIEGTIDIIAANGIEGLSIRAIAKHVGVEHSRIYYYFKNKDDLIFNVMVYITDLFKNELISRDIYNIKNDEELFKAIMNVFYDYSYKNPKPTMAYRSFCFLPDNHISKEIFNKTFDTIYSNFLYTDLIISMSKSSKTIQILGFENVSFITRTIADFAINNAIRNISTSKEQIDTYIDALWKAIKD
ncbi:hypothetical protein ADMFC3_23400 [Geovibrio sp. ADMFC3]